MKITFLKLGLWRIENIGENGKIFQISVFWKSILLTILWFINDGCFCSVVNLIETAQHLCLSIYVICVLTVWLIALLPFYCRWVLASWEFLWYFHCVLGLFNSWPLFNFWLKTQRSFNHLHYVFGFLLTTVFRYIKGLHNVSMDI